MWHLLPMGPILLPVSTPLALSLISPIRYHCFIVGRMATGPTPTPGSARMAELFRPMALRAKGCIYVQPTRLPLVQTIAVLTAQP